MYLDNLSVGICSPGYSPLPRGEAVPQNCHPERSEGSSSRGLPGETLRQAQGDTLGALLRQSQRELLEDLLLPGVSISLDLPGSLQGPAWYSVEAKVTNVIPTAGTPITSGWGWVEWSHVRFLVARLLGMTGCHYRSIHHNQLGAVLACAQGHHVIIAVDVAPTPGPKPG